jgi:MFS transporter, NNP family, nitrate/nitrite transporter
MATKSTPNHAAAGTWLPSWDPEDTTAWAQGGSSLAWRTLSITTLNLMMAFAAWFMVSALVVRLPQAGFQFSPSQLFWLAAMPGLAGGSLRLVHMFLTPMFGTRHVVSLSTLSLLLPLLGWFFAVQDLATPYWVLLVLAFLAGLGGGNFSSFMPSTSLFFPKRLQGTALAIQAGIGNLGVSVVQFVTPWIIGFALAGSAGFLGGSQTLTRAGVESQVWLQNAPAIMVPFVLVFGITAWLLLKSVPLKANFAQQFDIFRSRHTWSMTSLYIMTFGVFSGLAATFPLLIREVYGSFEGAPDPLAWAFWGPLVGSIARVIAGPLSDKLGGARVTQWSGLGMVACAIFVGMTTQPTSLASVTSWRRCWRCSSSPALAMRLLSSKCRCCSNRARRAA